MNFIVITIVIFVVGGFFIWMGLDVFGSETRTKESVGKYFHQYTYRKASGKTYKSSLTINEVVDNAFGSPQRYAITQIPTKLKTP